MQDKGGWRNLGNWLLFGLIYIDPMVAGAYQISLVEAASIDGVVDTRRRLSVTRRTLPMPVALNRSPARPSHASVEGL